MGPGYRIMDLRSKVRRDYSEGWQGKAVRKVISFVTKTFPLLASKT